MWKTESDIKEEDTSTDDNIGKFYIIIMVAFRIRRQLVGESLSVYLSETNQS